MDYISYLIPEEKNPLEDKVYHILSYAVNTFNNIVLEYFKDKKFNVDFIPHGNA